MNRYRVKTEDGELRLYYPTLEDAQADYPDAEITLCEDLSHIKYIEQMFNAVDKVCGMTERKGSLVYLLRFQNVGWRLLCNITQRYKRWRMV